MTSQKQIIVLTTAHAENLVISAYGPSESEVYLIVINLCPHHRMKSPFLPVMYEQIPFDAS